MGNPRQAATQRFSVHKEEADPWRCPEDEGPVHAPWVPSPGLTVQASGLVRAELVREMPAPCVGDERARRLEAENTQLRAELARITRKEHCALQQCEQVRTHWRGRVAELDAEVARLKAALGAAAPAQAEATRPWPIQGVRAAPTAPSSWKMVTSDIGNEDVQHEAAGNHGAGGSVLWQGLRSARASMPNLNAGQTASVKAASGVPPHDLETPRTPQASSGVRVTFKEMIDADWAVTTSSRPTSPTVNSPLARRPPPSRVWRDQKVFCSSQSAQQIPLGLPQAAFHGPGIGAAPKSKAKSNWGQGGPSTAGLRPGCHRAIVLGAPSPMRTRPARSRSVPLGQEVDEGSVMGETPPGSFLEAFGGFYKQLVQGTRCTGPEALAANERYVEIDLSGEFPPERREAQIDMQAPPPRPPSACFYVPPPAQRDLASPAVHNKDGLLAAMARSPGELSVHHL